MTNSLLGSGISMVMSLVCMGVTLFCIRIAEQHPSTRLYRTIPLSFFWAAVGLTLYSLLQAFLPFLDTPEGNILGTFIMWGPSMLAGTIFLSRARSREETGALLILLFVLLVILLGNIMELLPLPFSMPSPLAFFTAWWIIWSITLIPGTLFHRWLRARLRSRFPWSFNQYNRQTTRAPSREQWQSLCTTAACSTAAALFGLFVLIWQGRLQSLGAALLSTAGVMLALYLLIRVTYWGVRSLLLSRPSYRSTPREVATHVTVTAQPFDENQANLFLYQGATLEGKIPPLIQAEMDRALHTGEGVLIHYRYDNGVRGAQSLPSYCRGGWPQCLTCSCKEAISVAAQETAQKAEPLNFTE